MSAPQTNIEKQKKRHIGPLGGMLAVVVFAGALLAAFLIWTVSQSDGVEGAEAVVDGRTGAVEEVTQ